MSSKKRSNDGRPVGLEDNSRILHQALEFIRICARWERSTRLEVSISSITLYPPSTSRNGQWLVVGKSYLYPDKLVAFHRAPDPLTAVLGFLSRAEQQKIEWKKDEWKDRA